jgi:hypothetical protein
MILEAWTIPFTIIFLVIFGMSLVHVYVGQAGNQIGSACCRYVGAPAGAAGLKAQPGVSFIDSEPKVVRPLRVVGEPEYLPFATAESVVFDQNGRGNNWAWGYTGIASHRAPVRSPISAAVVSRTPPLLERALDSVRRQESVPPPDLCARTFVACSHAVSVVTVAGGVP